MTIRPVADALLAEKRQQAMQDHQRALRERLLADLRAVASTPHGARVLRWVIFDKCQLGDASPSLDAFHAGQREGRRLAGWEIETELAAVDPQLVKAVWDARFQHLEDVKAKE